MTNNLAKMNRPRGAGFDIDPCNKDNDLDCTFLSANAILIFDVAKFKFECMNLGIHDRKVGVYELGACKKIFLNQALAYTQSFC